VGDAGPGRSGGWFGDGSVGLPPAALALTVGAIAAVSFVLGFIGLQEYVPVLNRRGEQGLVFSDGFFDLLYYDIQLFIINCPPVSYGGPYPLALELARFGAPTATAYALLVTLWLLLDAQVRQVRARLARGHAVVCGGGPAALLLGRRLRRSGQHVVVVDEGASPAAARAMGLLHVVGDARDEDALRRAGVRRAAEVFVLHPDSAAGVATVLAVGRVSGRNGSPTCYAAIADREVCAGLLARHLAWPAPRRLRLHLLSLPELAAQALLEAEPPPAGPEPAHVVVVGLGEIGESLVIELARRRRTSSPGSAQPLLVTAADVQADAVVKRLERQAPFLARTCHVQPRALPVGEPHEAGLQELLAEDPPPDRVYVCCDDDAVALRVGLRALRARHRRPVRVVVCVERGTAFSDAFHGEDRLFDDAQGTLHVLAIMELLLRPDRIRSNLVAEQLAHALYGSYVEGCVARGEAPGSRPGLNPWDELPEELRESNRDQARHLGEKLAAIGCVLVPHFDPPLTFAYRCEDEVLLLARLEHDRWLRERRALGFVYGPHRDGRAHPDIVEWKHLSQEARDKDAQFIRDLPRVLADAGFQVLRLPSGAP
jgi:hypothetical protein